MEVEVTDFDGLEFGEDLLFGGLVDFFPVERGEVILFTLPHPHRLNRRQIPKRPQLPPPPICPLLLRPQILL